MNASRTICMGGCIMIHTASHKPLPLHQHTNLNIGKSFAESLALPHIVPGLFEHEFCMGLGPDSYNQSFPWKLIHQAVEALILLTQEGGLWQSNIVKE